MNIRSLLIAVCMVLPISTSIIRADGFIIVDRPAPGPPIPFPFAPLEVSYHHVDVKIQGQIATTRVDEDFYNPNPQQLEGTYLFPISRNAQIDKFSMEINGKEVAAELLAADKARAIYKDIVRRDRDPALLEYADRDVFRVRVFPIEGGGHKRLKISYTQILKADSGLVDYVYPLNTEKFSAALIHDVSVKVEITSEQPLTSIYSPTHEVEIKRPDPKHAVVGYEAKNVRPDTDFQLFFAPQKRDVSLDLLTQRTDGNDGYFLLLASPGQKTKERHLPKDVTFVLDTSGSMAEDNKLTQAKKALNFCLANLNPDDRFEIVRFSTEQEPLFGQLKNASEPHVAEARKFVENLQPTGGTAIFDALHQAMQLTPEKSDRPNIVVFITDGLPTVGEVDPDAIVRETDKASAAGTRVFCFGLGTDVNAHLLDRIEEKTHAVSDYVLPNEDLEVKVSSFFAKIREPVLANLKLTFPEGVRVTKMNPQQMPDLFRGDQLVLCGRYSGEGTGDCVVEGDAGSEHETYRVAVNFPRTTEAQPFVARLWASRRVGYLLDEIRLHGESAELKDEATELARQFGLVTPYTAFLIMEDERERHVVDGNQVMRDFQKDGHAQSSAGTAYQNFRSKVDGDAGVGVARSQKQMKEAYRVIDRLASVNVDAAKAMNVPTEVVSATSTAAPMSGTSYNTISAPADDAGTRVVQYTQRAKFIAGRAFYQNGSRWTDSNVSERNDLKSVRVSFGSERYFALMDAHLEARAWFALGQNVKLQLGETVYEISSDKT